MKPATCHPDRPYKSRGLCNACYLRHWYAGTLPSLPKRECPICRLSFEPDYAHAVYCSDTCRRFQRSRSIAAERQSVSDHYLTTHREAMAADVARTLRGRGFRRVGPQARRRGGNYFSAWKRSTRDGHHLFVVRWWSTRCSESWASSASLSLRLPHRSRSRSAPRRPGADAPRRSSAALTRRGWRGRGRGTDYRRGESVHGLELVILAAWVWLVAMGVSFFWFAGRRLFVSVWGLEPPATQVVMNNHPPPGHYVLSSAEGFSVLPVAAPERQEEEA